MDNYQNYRELHMYDNYQEWDFEKCEHEDHPDDPEYCPAARISI